MSKNTIGKWLKNARVGATMQSLMPSVVAVVTAIGTEGFSWWLALVAVAGVWCAHLACNLIDDYFDYKADMLKDRQEVVRKGIKAYTAKYPYLTDGEVGDSGIRTAGRSLRSGGRLAARLGDTADSAGGRTAGILLFGSSDKVLLLGHGRGGDRPDLRSAADGGCLLGSVGSDGPEGAGCVSAPYICVVVAVAMGWLHLAYLAVLLLLPRSIWLYWSLVQFEKGADFEKELEHPRRMLGPMPKDWAGIRKAGLDWFLIRWMTARNIVSDFCLTFIIVKVILLMVA